MISERLDIIHKELLYEKLRKVGTQISEYCFSNLFLFREVHRYEVLLDKEVFIRGKTYDGYTYLMPTVDVRNIEPGYLKSMMKAVDFLFPVPEEWLTFFGPENYEITFKEGDKDYMYTVERMSTYRGRRLHKKRNLLKQFTETYAHEAAPLTVHHREDALYILNEWRKESGQGTEETDYGPCLEALKMSEELILCGGIYFADREPAGFVLGEEVNEETYVLHFAKARRKFKGIYQYMFNSFAKFLPGKYRFLNFEQDLEREALRIAKSSYLPEYLLRKMRVRVISQ